MNAVKDAIKGVGIFAALFVLGFVFLSITIFYTIIDLIRWAWDYSACPESRVAYEELYAKSDNDTPPAS